VPIPGGGADAARHTERVRREQDRHGDRNVAARIDVAVEPAQTQDGVRQPGQLHQDDGAVVI